MIGCVAASRLAAQVQMQNENLNLNKNQQQNQQQHSNSNLSSNLKSNINTSSNSNINSSTSSSSSSSSNLNQNNSVGRNEESNVNKNDNNTMRDHLDKSNMSENRESNNNNSKKTNCFSKKTFSYFTHPDIEKYKNEYTRNTFLRQIIASSLGTCVSVLTLNPISVIKLRLQRQDVFMETSVRGAVRTIWKRDGIRGFWAGNFMSIFYLFFYL